MSVNLFLIQCGEAWLSLACKSYHILISMTPAHQLNFLLNGKANSCNRYLAFLVVDYGISSNHLNGLIDIFLELPHHARDTLAHATPGSDFALVHLIDCDSEVGGWLSYDQDLLVHNLTIHPSCCNELGLDMIFNECHRLSSHIGAMKEH